MSGEQIQEQYDEEISALKQELFSEISLGDESQKFFNTKLGSYLLSKATEAEESAFKAFIDVDPDDAKAIREIQDNAKIPKLIFAWLSDAIENGNTASQQVQELEHDE